MRALESQLEESEQKLRAESQGRERATQELKDIKAANDEQLKRAQGAAAAGEDAKVMRGCGVGNKEERRVFLSYSRIALLLSFPLSHWPEVRRVAAHGGAAGPCGREGQPQVRGRRPRRHAQRVPGCTGVVGEPSLHSQPCPSSLPPPSPPRLLHAATGRLTAGPHQGGSFQGPDGPRYRGPEGEGEVCHPSSPSSSSLSTYILPHFPFSLSLSLSLSLTLSRSLLTSPDLSERCRRPRPRLPRKLPRPSSAPRTACATSRSA